MVYISSKNLRLSPKHCWISLFFIPKIVLTVNFCLHQIQSESLNKHVPPKKYCRIIYCYANIKSLQVHFIY